MLIDELIRLATTRIEIEFVERREQFSQDMQWAKSELTLQGLECSGAMQERIVQAITRAFDVRAMLAWQVLSRLLSGQPFSSNPQLSSQLKEQIAKHLRAGCEDLAVQYQWAISLFPGTGAFQSFDDIRERAVAKSSSEIDISLLASRQQPTTGSGDHTVTPIPMLIDTARLSEVRTLQVTGYDLTRLVQLCEELNACYQVGAYHAVIMLTRAILDHVPPLFGYKSFTEVANNYAGTRSFNPTTTSIVDIIAIP